MRITGLLVIAATATAVAVPPLAGQWVDDPFARGRIRDAAVSPDGRSVAYTAVSADREADRYRSSVMLIPADSGAGRIVAAGRMPAWSPDGRMLAYLKEEDGFVALIAGDSAGGSPRELARFEAVAAFRWSPDGRRIAVAARPAGEPAGPEAVGSVTRLTRLLLVDAMSGTVSDPGRGSFLIGVDDPGLPGIAEFDWFDDVTLVVAGRGTGGMPGNASFLYLLDLSTGEYRYLAGEGGRWHRPVVSPDRSWVAFVGHPLSDRTYLAEELLILRRDGSGLRRLTVGLDRDVADLAWSPDSRTIWFAVEDRGSRNLQRVQIRDGRMEPGTTGTHQLALAAIAPRGGFGVAIRETSGDPGVLVRFPLDRPWQMRPLVVPDQGLPAGQLDEFEFRSAAGTIVAGFLRVPPDFDPAVRYPLMVELHGGPQAMSGTGYTPDAVAYSRAGWLVLRVNHSGSLGYGIDLANAVGYQWPGRELSDIREAISEVAARGFVDTTRMVLTGEGGGAVSAAALAIASPQLFRAVVMRCADGGFLTGGSGYDSPSWGSWRYARPYSGSLALWLGRSPLHDAGSWRLPLLVRRGEGSAAEPFDFGTAFAVAAARSGAEVMSHQVAGVCTGAGPASLLAAHKAERAWLERHTRPGPP